MLIRVGAMRFIPRFWLFQRTDLTLRLRRRSIKDLRRLQLGLDAPQEGGLFAEVAIGLFLEGGHLALDIFAIAEGVAAEADRAGAVGNGGFARAICLVESPFHVGAIAAPSRIRRHPAVGR